MFLCDGYKLDHRRQYPDNTTNVYSNFTPRKGRFADDHGVVAFGFQYMLQRFFMDHADDTFFGRWKDDVVSEYRQFLDEYLGPNTITVDHIADLWDVGYLPLEFRAVPEGTFVPYGVPILTVENTLPEFAWLTNYFETLISSVLWQPISSATTARKYFHILNEANIRTAGADGALFTPWQGHDFSFRGMAGPEAAALSGAGHLLYFTGTDTIPAIPLLKEYYAAEGLIGGSVAATEHSVMSAGGKADEIETMRRLLALYPTGILSVVSDTWDLWKVCVDIVPKLKREILARDGKLVIRPDSGDPELILCGNPNADAGSFAERGVVQLLADVFGTTKNAQGYKVLDPHIGVIYGDSITTERATAIIKNLERQGFASTNVVFGIGSFTYQFNTRDTHGFAMKATAATVDGVERELWKKPITDDGTKFSARGRLAVLREWDGTSDTLVLQDGLNKLEWESFDVSTLLQPIWRDGDFVRTTTLDEIRKRAVQ